MDTATAMIAAARLELPVDADLRRLNAEAYAIDSTTIALCLKLFPWAHFRRRKGGIKVHTMFDLGAGIPVFLRVSHPKTPDLWMLDQITPQAGAFYVMDRGYVDFARLHRRHAGAAFCITRAKRGMDSRVIERRAVSSEGNVRSDRLVRLCGPKSRTLYPDTLRLVRYVDPHTQKRFMFMTNNMALDPTTVALLYRRRWRIELFFKWVKQHLHSKAFFGTTPNAVKAQLWIAVIVFVLTVKLKHRYRLSQNLNEVLQILSVTILEKTHVFRDCSINTECVAPDATRIRRFFAGSRWERCETGALSKRVTIFGCLPHVSLAFLLTPPMASLCNVATVSVFQLFSEVRRADEIDPFRN